MLTEAQLNTLMQVYREAAKSGPSYLRLNMWIEDGESHFMFTDAPRTKKNKNAQKPTNQKMVTPASEIGTTDKSAGEPPITRRAAKKRKAAVISPARENQTVVDLTPEAPRGRGSISETDPPVVHAEDIIAAIPSVPTSNRYSGLRDLLDENEGSDTSSNSSHVTPSNTEDCACPEDYCVEFLREINEPGFLTGSPLCGEYCSCLHEYPSRDLRSKPDSKHSCKLCAYYLIKKNDQKNKKKTYSEAARSNRK